MKVSSVKDIIAKVLAFQLKEIEEFDFHVDFRPGIGDQYETALSTSLNAVLPVGADLRVVSGYIGNHKKTLSGQIDCMLVKGGGRRVPSSKEDYVYHVKDVLMIFEVKKNFSARDLADAFIHLKDLQEFNRNIKGLSLREWQEFQDIYYKCTRCWINAYEEVNSLDLQNEFIFHELLTQYSNPTRVIFSYYGLKTEETLRDKFFEFLMENVGVQGFGPFSMPDLIIAENSCILKFNGQPYIPLLENERLMYMGSATGQNMEILAEMVASRVARHYDVDYSDTNSDEQVNKFISAKLFVKDNEPRGWEYLVHGYQDSSEPDQEIADQQE